MIHAEFAKDFVAFAKGLFPGDSFIPLHAPRFSAKEKELVLDTLESTFVSTVGEYVGEFESRIAEFTGAQFVTATNNGTAALHTALMLADLQPGDEVITQSLTFVATCNAVRYCGGNPVFVDIDKNTLGLSPDSLLAFLEEYGEVRNDGLCWNRTTNRIMRACVPVHNLGHPARIGDIQQLCNRYNIFLIEDAAESLGSLSDGVHTGLTGHIGTLSFNGNKIITTGGGGALITDNDEIARQAKHLTTTAKLSHPWLFLHDKVGYNYRLPNLNAALGCAQMEKLPRHIESKRKLAEKYRNWMVSKGVEFVSEPVGTRSNYWLNAILLNSKAERDDFLQNTNTVGVMTRPMWTPMHTLPMYRECFKADLKNSDDIEARLVCIPSSAR